MSGRVRIKWEFDEDAAILRPEIPAEPDNNEKQLTRDLEAIHNIITGNVLTTVFQPVFNRENGSVLGYEALTRLRKENPFGEIRELFLRALQTGCICALDCACLSTTLNTVHTLSLAGKPEFLFVNTCPETLMNGSLFLDTCDNLIETFGISREKIVLEITEESMISNYAIFRQSLETYRRQGYKIAIDDVSRRIQSRNNALQYDDICVTRTGKYHGTVPISLLLNSIMERNINLAKGSNPLSGLPGNEFIQREITLRLNQSMHFDVAYIDIDNFKPFNDHYGFERGDFIIKSLAAVITGVLSRLASSSFNFALSARSTGENACNPS
jgi:predicted signal transduction protein with EAL and GGDEF domain